MSHSLDPAQEKTCQKKDRVEKHASKLKKTIKHFYKYQIIFYMVPGLCVCSISFRKLYFWTNEDMEDKDDKKKVEEDSRY